MSDYAPNQIVKVEWSIKGYHIFRIKPHNDLDLKVEVDEGNPFDDDAMKVVMPNLEEIPVHLHDAETYPNHPRSRIVRDIAGTINFQVNCYVIFLDTHAQIYIAAPIDVCYASDV